MKNIRRLSRPKVRFHVLLPNGKYVARRSAVGCDRYVSTREVDEPKDALPMTFNVATWVAQRNEGHLVTVAPVFADKGVRVAPFLNGVADDLPFCALVLVVAMAFASCSTTRPLNAYTLADGTKVGVSKNIVFFRGYDANEGQHVAQDYANITTVDSVSVKRRIRAFGSSFITTVTGH